MRFLAFLLFICLVLGGAYYADLKGMIDLPFEKIPGLAKKDSTEQDNSETSPAGSPETSSTQAPVASSTLTPAKTATPTPAADNDPLAARYPIPDFKPIEVVLENWTKIPASAFPRPVKVTGAVKREIRSPEGKVIGSSNVPAGTELQALGMEGANVVLANSTDAAARSLAPLDSTNLKEILSEAYQTFQKHAKNRVLAQREAARAENVASGAASSSPAERPTVSLANAGPTMSSIPTDDPKFAPMIASIKSGKYSEIELDSVTAWRWVGTQEVLGSTYDVGTINFNAMTIFGELPAEAMALIKNGRVDKWVYTGSMEPVQ